MNNAIGTLKFSAKGDKLVACHAFDNDVVELMDFDNTTGIISNPIVIYTQYDTASASFTGVIWCRVFARRQITLCIGQ